MTTRDKDRMAKSERNAFSALIAAEKTYGASDKFTLVTRAYWLGQYDLCQTMGVYEDNDVKRSTN